LLLLVSAFAGVDRAEAYREAVEKGTVSSYGDAMLIL
jgi:S-adenosylmethionine:tRNA-ribosyltransferase-isomerase (queuine synthetase)